MMTVNMQEHRWWRMWPTMFVGALIGLLLIPAGDWASHFLRDAYDDTHPVVVAEGTLIERTDDAVTVAIHGEKKRDCQYIAIAAYTLGDDGLLRSTFIQRFDQPQTNATRPIGRQTFGTWRIWPTVRSVSVEVWISHQCDGRLVRTRAAQVALT